jgi:methylated-DNA-[protein]-cysteine S-methyltransferase
MARISLSSPLGPLTLREQDGAIVALAWDSPPPRGAEEAQSRAGNPTALLLAARSQLEAYFAGRLRRFDLPLAPAGTAFQRSLWRALREIPFGETETYGALARRLESGPRAAAAACARNPIPILIPCHRVIAAAGRLGGYSAPRGIAAKRLLLRLEGAAVR